MVGFLRRLTFILLFVPFTICVPLIAYLFWGSEVKERCFEWFDRFGEV